MSLFERQANGVRPTIAGLRFFERTRAALTEIDYAMKNAAAAGRGEEGLIRIGVVLSLFPDFLSDLLIDFRSAQPGVVVDMLDASPRGLVARLMGRRLDVAFITEATPTPGCDRETLPNGGLILALADRHPLAGCELVDWELLKDEHFVLGRQAIAMGLDDYVSKTLTRQGGRPSLATYDASLDVVMRLVSSGIGVSLIDEYSTAISYPGVTFRGLASEEGRICSYAAWLPGNDNPALRRFLSLMRSKAPQARSASTPQASD